VQLVKFLKFAGFVIIGISLIKVAFWIGMWIIYLGMVGILVFVGYQIFLKDK